MNETTVTIPTGYVGAVTDSLLLLFGSTAESTYKAIQNADLAEIRLDLCAYRWRLRRLGELIDQLERSAGTPAVVLSVADALDLLAEALHGVLCDKAEALGDACQQFLDGADPDTLRDHHAAVSNVLDVIAALGPPHRVRVTMPDDIAEQVQQAADRTGYPHEEIVMAALARRIEEIGAAEPRHGEDDR
ncbi:hypothetical protein [Conexibacter woesei]|uniref:Uncharacterized protein n=1 Tax=Conexibacter woesei (strain DSM 14684 / CCUG 47730 / CIP 108061 / JCM 11494 / NBRC 100937 / ID131577) TaxID=469383 RepID=D3F9G1_CONWI|nr:hypothetical protein [Conexibacter woesei]ADB49128.1 hypothetical protein Cwoe_0695 [Conexibacter woesei DSM 14684]